MKKFHSILVRRQRTEDEIAFMHRVDRISSNTENDVFSISYPDLYHAVIVTAREKINGGKCNGKKK